MNDPPNRKPPSLIGGPIGDPFGYRSWAEAPGPLPHPLPAHAAKDTLQRALMARPRGTASPDFGTPSAVMATLFEYEEDTHVWLLRRQETMRRHGGQVALPGGKFELLDADLRATALREAEEEVGLLPASVEILGALDDLVTGTGYVVTPYVGWLTGPFEPKAQQLEVARIFSAPLRAFCATPSGTFPRIGLTVEGEFVWGATFAILRHLCDILTHAVARSESGAESA